MPNSISTEKVLKYVIEAKQKHEQEAQAHLEAAKEIDRVIQEFRAKHGPQIEATQAFEILKELEQKHGQAE